MAPNIPAIVTSAIAFVSLLFCIISFARNGRKDTAQAIESEALKFEVINQSMVEMKIKLEAINGMVTETRSDVKSTATDISNLHSHISMMDEKLNNVTARVDDLEEHVFHKGILPANV